MSKSKRASCLVTRIQSDYKSPLAEWPNEEELQCQPAAEEHAGST
jgi:hypothetical protein